MSVDISLFERLPEPVLLLGPGGELLYANVAFNDLVRAHGVSPRLMDLFGPPAHVLLAEARRSGSASAFLPLVVGEDLSRGYRIHARADEAEQTIAVQLTDLSEEVAWRHQLFMRNSELAVLNDIGAALSSTLDLKVLGHRLWEQMGRIMDNSNFYIALHNQKTNEVVFSHNVLGGVIQSDESCRPFSNGMTEYVLRTKQPLLVNGDVHAQLRELGIAPHGRPCASFLGAPIVIDGVAVGVLAVVDYERANRYGRHELGVINVVATQAAAALRNARLFEDARLAYHELSEAQAKLLESERLRGVTETVGAMNHEVNNPLATIAGTAQLLLRERERLGPDTSARVERILEAAKRIQHVTSRMASIIQTSSRPYPGQAQILDVHGSIARDEPPATEPGEHAA